MITVVMTSPLGSMMLSYSNFCLFGNFFGKFFRECFLLKCFSNTPTITASREFWRHSKKGFEWFSLGFCILFDGKSNGSRKFFAAKFKFFLWSDWKHIIYATLITFDLILTGYLCQIWADFANSTGQNRIRIKICVTSSSMT